MKKLAATMLAASMALSSAGAFAFSDMAQTENTALTEKLGIIEGYSDGTFKPDENITRAETVKILVKALNLSDEDIMSYGTSKSGVVAETSEGELTFKDVSKNHWAYDYIHEGVLNGFIEGFDDDTFDPDGNVTVEQVVTMLVSLVGYKTYGEAMGGYPSGFMLYASTLGISENLKGETYTMPATREQVLDMTANTLNVPICVIESWEPGYNGVLPVLAIKDGEGKDYQSLLTERFGVYEVTATVNEIKDDILTLSITDAINFDDKRILDKAEKAVVKLNGNDKNSFKKGKEYKMYIRVNDSDSKDYDLVCGFEK